MGVELQLRQTNFETFSKGPVSLRSDMEYDEAKDIIVAHCFVRNDKKKEWFVRMPHLEVLGDTSLLFSPELLYSQMMDKDCMSTCKSQLIQSSAYLMKIILSVRI